MPDVILIFRMKLKLSTMVPTAFEPLWRALGQPPFGVEKYNDTEPMRLQYDANLHREAWELWIMRGGGLLFKRGKVYLGSLNDGPAGVAHFEMELPIPAGDTDIVARQLVDWVVALEPAFEILFACVCTKDEFEEKHRDEHGDRHGFSHWSFLEYFQGLYWYTYLGKQAVEYLPPELPATFEDWHFTRTPGGGLGIQLQDQVVMRGVGMRLEAGHELARMLGESWFFDRFRGKEEDYHHPPEYFAYLAALQDDLDLLQRRFDGRDADSAAP